MDCRIIHKKIDHVSEKFCQIGSKLSTFNEITNPLAVRWQDQTDNIHYFTWHLHLLDGSVFVGNDFLAKANKEQDWLFKTDIILHFVDSIVNWNENLTQKKYA